MSGAERLATISASALEFGLAFEEAIAALPEGWRFAGLYLSDSKRVWTARAYRAGEKHPFGKPGDGVVAADGTTPAEALRSLSKKLQEHP
jgi:hypothetical protein